MPSAGLCRRKPMDRFGANNNDPLRFDLVRIIRLARRGRVAADFVISEDQPQFGAHLTHCWSRLEPQPMERRYSDNAESKRSRRRWITGRLRSLGIIRHSA